MLKKKYQECFMNKFAIRFCSFVEKLQNFMKLMIILKVK